MESVTIIDYGVGNLGSIRNMLKKVGADAVVSSDPDTIEKAQKLILPGVGAFDSGIRSLRESGLVDLLATRVIGERIPILGFCLGMQLFTRGSEEGELEGLGWLKARTVRFRIGSKERGLKVPHMGWNYVQPRREDPLLEGLPADSRFYFVHTYHLVCEEDFDVLATTSYGYEFPSLIRRGNIIGAQFHPEKSHRFGMQLLRNFVERI
jgi:imidazole glycerol-phosphate synthase subunit HisH